MNSLEKYPCTLNIRYFRQRQPELLSYMAVGHSLAGLSLYDHTGSPGNTRTLGTHATLNSLETSVEETLQYRLRYKSRRVPFNPKSCGSNAFMTQRLGEWNEFPRHPAQFLAGANVLRDKRLVDQAAWAQNRVISPQVVPDYAEIRGHSPVNDADLRLCGLCDMAPYA